MRVFSNGEGTSSVTGESMQYRGRLFVKGRSVPSECSECVVTSKGVQ